MAQLIVTMGVPGSGKSWWASRQTVPVVASDILVTTWPRSTAAERSDTMEALRQRAETLLANDQSVVFDACHVWREARLRTLAIARRTGAEAHLVVLHCGRAQAAANQRQRHRTVPPRVMWRYWRDFSAALAEVEGEGWDSITHVRAGETYTQGPRAMEKSRAW